MQYLSATAGLVLNVRALSFCNATMRCLFQRVARRRWKTFRRYAEPATPGRGTGPENMSGVAPCPPMSAECPRKNRTSTEVRGKKYPPHPLKKLPLLRYAQK